jgi:hypothetical protein
MRRRTAHPATTATKENIMTEPVLDTSQVIELRQYTLHAGKREALIDLFDDALIDAQEEMGMRVLGQFRDLDAPDRFVWLRGFPDLASRADKLAAFYGGPAWKANRDAANATMIDSDDVLLLRPVDAESGLLLPERRPLPAVEEGSSLVVTTVYLLRAPVDGAFLHFFEAQVSPLMAQAGAPPLARYHTEYGKNEFPKLPVREGEHAFVWIKSFAAAADHERHLEALALSAAWKGTVEPALARYLRLAPQVLRLAATARSLLRHREPVGPSTHGPQDEPWRGR